MSARHCANRSLGEPVVIFDCNGVLVDGEQISAAVAAEEFTRAGIPMSPQLVARFFTGRRVTDMIADIETATGRKLPANFAGVLAAATLRRIRDELRATPHAAYALTWLRGPKCVASSTSLERIRVSLETAGLLRFFEPNVFSASDVPHGKPRPICSCTRPPRWASGEATASWWKIRPWAWRRRSRPA